MNKISAQLLIVLVLSLCIVSCNTKENKAKNVNVTEITPFFHSYDTVASVVDLFTDIQFIPLENNKECMLSSVSKIRIDGDRMFIYDRGPENKVLEFGLDGSFIRRISNMGGSKSEYLAIDDVAINPYEKTVLILYYNKIKIFDYDGKFIKEVALDECKHANYQIEAIRDGYVMSTRYEGSEYLLQLFDKDFHVKEHLVYIGEKRLGYGPLVIGNMSLNYDGKNVYFYDPYDSKFYIFNPDSTENMQCYSIKDDNIVTFDKVAAAEKQDKSLECNGVLNCFSANNKMFGCYIYNNAFDQFVFDYEKKTCDAYRLYDWLPTLKEYHDGYYYTILSAEDVINMSKGLQLQDDQRTYHVFEDAVSKFKEPLSPKSNYVLVRMKLKE